MLLFLSWILAVIEDILHSKPCNKCPTIPLLSVKTNNVSSVIDAVRKNSTIIYHQLIWEQNCVVTEMYYLSNIKAENMMDHWISHGRWWCTFGCYEIIQKTNHVLVPGKCIWPALPSIISCDVFVRSILLQRRNCWNLRGRMRGRDAVWEASMNLTVNRSLFQPLTFHLQEIK